MKQTRLSILFLLFWIAVALSLGAQCSHAQKIGFSVMPTQSNFLSGQLPHEIIARQLLFQPLVRSAPSKNSRFDHVLTRGFTSSPSENRYSFLLSPEARFTNGVPVTVLDVVWSLQRCGVFPGTSKGRDFQLSETHFENWIDFTITDEKFSLMDLINFLGKCPILEYKNSVIFGSLLGIDANFVSSAEFEIVDFLRERGLVLARTTSFPKRKGPPSVELRHEPEERRSLSLLRGGELDAIVVGNPEVVALAKSDDTLVTEPCGDSHLVKRRISRLTCADDFSFFGELYRDDV